MQRRQSGNVAVTLSPRDDGRYRGLGTFELTEPSNQRDQLGRLQENETACAVVVREGAKGLIAQ